MSKKKHKGLGRQVLRVPESFAALGEDRRKKARPQAGRVTWIHPQGRYHVVEFALPGGTVRECFPGAPEV